MATRLAKKLNDVRKNGDLWWLRPEQSPVIAGGVLVGKDDDDVDVDVDAGGQEIMFGCATDKTEDNMSLTRPMATRLRKKWTDVRRNGDR